MVVAGAPATRVSGLAFLNNTLSGGIGTFALEIRNAGGSASFQDVVATSAPNVSGVYDCPSKSPAAGGAFRLEDRGGNGGWLVACGASAEQQRRRRRQCAGGQVCTGGFCVATNCTLAAV